MRCTIKGFVASGGHARRRMPGGGVQKRREERDRQRDQPGSVGGELGDRGRDRHADAHRDADADAHRDADHPDRGAIDRDRDRHGDRDRHADRERHLPEPSPSAAASGGSSGTSLLWLWILLGVLILAGLITWIATSGRRRKAAAAGWRSRLIDAYAKGSALHDAMSVAEVQGDLGAGDARARWYDIQRRADDLAQTLYTLREAAPDPEDQAAIADVLASLQAVREAMDAERAPGGARPELAEVVRRRLYAFESSLRALRAGDEQNP